MRLCHYVCQGPWLDETAAIRYETAAIGKLIGFIQIVITPFCGFCKVKYVGPNETDTWVNASFESFQERSKSRNYFFVKSEGLKIPPKNYKLLSSKNSYNSLEILLSTTIR